MDGGGARLVAEEEGVSGGAAEAGVEAAAADGSAAFASASILSA